MLFSASSSSADGVAACCMVSHSIKSLLSHDLKSTAPIPIRDELYSCPRDNLRYWISSNSFKFFHNRAQFFPSCSPEYCGEIIAV